MRDDLWFHQGWESRLFSFLQTPLQLSDPSPIKHCLTGGKQPGITLRHSSSTSAGAVGDGASTVNPALESHLAPPEPRQEGTRGGDLRSCQRAEKAPCRPPFALHSRAVGTERMPCTEEDDEGRGSSWPKPNPNFREAMRLGKEKWFGESSSPNAVF